MSGAGHSVFPASLPANKQIHVDAPKISTVERAPDVLPILLGRYEIQMSG